MAESRYKVRRMEYNTVTKGYKKPPPGKNGRRHLKSNIYFIKEHTSWV